MRLLERNPADLLAWTPANHPEPVAWTWSLSFQRVEAYSSVATDLLRLCAFFAPDNIPIRLLKAGAAATELSPELRAALSDELTSNMAIAVLRRYSLLSRKADHLGMHRLVQEVVRESLRGQGRREVWTSSAVGVLAAVFPETDQTEVPATWAECEELVPHALAAATFGTEERTELTQCASLLVRAATYLRARAEYGSARALYERALDIYERVLGPDHSDVAEVLNRLAYLLRAQGDVAAARPHLERALGI
jgi:tetratricopeptide (TPR) repeat protein